MKLRTRIAATYIMLTVLGIALVSVISTWQIRRYLEDRESATLSVQANLLAQQFSDGVLRLDSTGHGDSVLAAFANALGVRMTILSADGRALYDSDIPRDSLRYVKHQRWRPEIVTATERHVGTDRRSSAAVDPDFLYAAARVHVPSNAALDSGFVRLALSAGEARAVVTRVQTIVWIVGLLTILLAAVASMHMARKITDPILAIGKTAESITGGDLKIRVPATRDDEIGTLATSINRLAETLSTDIERLKKLERVRSEFLANVSHELRTPIFSIQGFLETLIDGAVDDPAVNRDFLAKAHAHAERLNELLSDLIEISRIESGEMKMSHRYFALGEFLTHVVEDVAPLADRKGISITLENLPASGGNVFGDKERIKQVMDNLIGNAIKYTGSGGSITVSVDYESPRAKITVADTGCGIPEEHLGRIFERFYRVDKDRARDVGGTGLGLAIVKHIVEAHGSTINVRSVVGKGSEFSFTLKR
jgi:two-component system phosphate regulon sensor histidine kinase PhoR